jgi:hypothetical protein
MTRNFYFFKIFCYNILLFSIGGSVMDRFLTWFIFVWIGLVVIANLMGIAGTALTTNSFWDFLEWLQETYSPFNIWNWGLNILFLLPAIGAYAWRKRRRKKVV